MMATTAGTSLLVGSAFAQRRRRQVEANRVELSPLSQRRSARCGRAAGGVAVRAESELGAQTPASTSRRAVLGVAGASLFATLKPAPANAKEVTIALEDMEIRLCANPVAAGTPGTGTFKAKCYEIVGTAVNSYKETVNNADVYGIVLDAANDPVLRSGRVGAIESVPPGKSPFRLEITVAASQLLPLRLKSFRGVGFLGSVVNRPGNPYDMDYASGTFPSGSTTKI